MLQFFRRTLGNHWLQTSKSFRLACISALTSVATANCVRQGAPSQPKITNANKAATNEFPSVVLISLGKSLDETCSGTFISSETVITAAHCISHLQQNEMKPSGNLKVFVGGPKGKEIPIKKVFFPKWAGQQNMPIDGYDLAILQVSENSAPAVSPIRTKSVAPGDSIVLAGYGMLTRDVVQQDTDFNDDLELYHGSNSVLATNEHYIFAVGESLPQGKSPVGKDSITAPGDSGGPVLIGKTLAGVTSWGPPYTLTKDHIQKIQQSRPSPKPSPATIEQDGWAQLRDIPTLDAIKKRIEKGEKLGFSAHTNLTLPHYLAWLKSLESKGVKIQFE